MAHDSRRNATPPARVPLRRAVLHDYSLNVISVRTGGFVTKRQKNWTTRHGTERHLICVEDPFEVSHDLGRVVDRSSITILKDEFALALRVLRTQREPVEVLFEEFMAPKEVATELKKAEKRAERRMASPGGREGGGAGGQGGGDGGEWEEGGAGGGGARSEPRPVRSSEGLAAAAAAGGRNGEEADESGALEDIVGRLVF